MSASIVNQNLFDVQPSPSTPPVGRFEDYIESLEKKSLSLSSTPSISSITSNNQPSFRSAFNDHSFVGSLGSNYNNSFDNSSWVATPSSKARDVTTNGGDVTVNTKQPLARVDSFFVWNEPLSRDNFNYTYHDDPSLSTEKELKQQLSTSSDNKFSNNMNMVKKRGLFSRSGGSLSMHSKSMASTSSNAGNLDRMSGDSSSGNGKSGLSSSTALPDADEDKFNGEGVLFVGKLIGTEYVADARGEQMCQQSLKKLKVGLVLKHR